MTRRHQDQIFRREHNQGDDSSDSVRNQLETQSGEPTVAEIDAQQSSEMESNTPTVQEYRNETGSHRYPTRVRQKPDYYGQNGLTE